MLVTTVSYPVIQEQELMGVAAVSVPVIELAQLVHAINVSYMLHYWKTKLTSI